MAETRFNLRYIPREWPHATVQVFVDGALSGELVMDRAQAQAFSESMRVGASEQGNLLEMTGPWRDLYNG